MINRMIGAARLQVATFEDVEADRSATTQAVLVVIIVAISTGIGAIGIGSAEGGVANLLVGVVVALAGWVVWAWITYMIGTKILPTAQTHADWGELARTLAFAQSPGVLKVAGIIPVIGPLFFMVASIWQFVAMVIAVRQALDYASTLRAIAVVFLGFIPYMVLLTIFVLLQGNNTG